MAAPIEVKFKKTEARTVAFVAMKGPYSQISAAFSRLYGWMGTRGYAPSGPPSGVYFNAPGQVSEDELSWELRSPVSKQVETFRPNAQGFGVRRVSGAQVAATTHKGPYDRVGETYELLGDWLIANGYEIVGPSEEIYFSDPSQTPPEELLTEVRFPVRKKRS